MALLLRKVNSRRWLALDGLDWLDEGDIPADPLGDLTTKDNALSLWHIDDDRGNLNRVVAAMATTCDYISKFDYALFDERFLSQIGIDLEQTPAQTPDAEANAAWHYDLKRLSARKLVELAKLILRADNRERINPPRVKSLVTGAVAAGHLEIASLSQKVREQLGLK